MSSLILEFMNDRWQLKDMDQPKIHPVSVDFLARDVQRRMKEGKGGQLLYRAVNAPEVKSVLDATAGLGGDSIQLASWGFEVFACERNEKVFKLLEDGVRRLKVAAEEVADLKIAAENLKVFHVDARKKLSELKPDVVFLDPMYPDLKSSALPKKEMQLLRKLFLDVDPEEETLELLDAALKSATKRVVIKRPPAAPLIAKPSHSLEGKAVRFDIYLTKN